MLINSRKRRKYINDYKINDEGKYQYYGTCYRWMEPDNRKRVLHGFWAAQLSALLIPYMAGIVLSIMSVFALYNLSDEPDPVRDHVFNATVRRLPVLEMLNIITGLLCTAGEIYYLIAYGPEEDIAFGILFMVLEALIAFLSLRIFRGVRALQWEKVENDEMKSSRRG